MSSRQFSLTVRYALLILTVVSGNLFGQTTKPLNPEDSFLNHLKKNRIVMLGEALTIIFGRVPSDFLPKDDREEWPLYLPNPVAPPPIPDRK